MSDGTEQEASVPEQPETGTPGVTDVGPAEPRISSTAAVGGPVSSELDGPSELDDAVERTERD